MVTELKVKYEVLVLSLTLDVRVCVYVFPALFPAKFKSLLHYCKNVKVLLYSTHNSCKNIVQKHRGRRRFTETIFHSEC